MEYAEPKVLELPPTPLIGKKAYVTMDNGGISKLWQSFKPLLKQAELTADQRQYAVRCYDGLPQFVPGEPFEAWSAISASQELAQVNGLESMEIRAGLFARFTHVGKAEQFPQLMRYIFVDWLPNSGYELDDRPHFESFALDHDMNDPEGVEEVFIPIKRKGD